MYYVLPVRISVEVTFKRNILVKDYTAKLVKSLLISGNPELSEVFSKCEGYLPKPIHITPLYIIRESEGGLRKSAVYTRFVPRRSLARPPSINELEPVSIKAFRKYSFIIGTSLNLLDRVLKGLSNIGSFMFNNNVIAVDSVSYEVQYVDLAKEMEAFVNFLRNEESGRSFIKVTFESPTLLKDPLVISRKRKKKLLIPLPEAVLSVPVYMVLINEGKARKSIFLRCMRYIKSVLDIPYTVLKTINLVWYVYSGKILPAVIGYTKYFIDKQMLQSSQILMKMKHELDFIELLSKAVILAQIYGVGDGRAAGFGHISITF